MPQFIVVRGLVRIRGEEDANKEDEEDEEVRYGEGGVVYQAKNGPLAATRGDVASAGSRRSEPVYAGDLIAQTAEPGRTARVRRVGFATLEVR